MTCICFMSRGGQGGGKSIRLGQWSEGPAPPGPSLDARDDAARAGSALSRFLGEGSKRRAAGEGRAGRRGRGE